MSASMDVSKFEFRVTKNARFFKKIKMKTATQSIMCRNAFKWYMSPGN